MKKDLNKFGFFDFVLFNYMFKNTIKNKGLYICSLMYFIVIFVIVFIIPKFGDLSPNQILLNPIVICIVILVISILAALLGIILFKAPVDDGTELLIVSKPLSRLEILSTKIIIFLINSLILSILGSVFSLFVFLNKNTIIETNWFIVLGFFVGSFVSFCFFGFLSLIVCLFAKKILVFISVCGLAMVFFLITTLNSLMSSNPVKNMIHDGKEVRSSVWISDTRNNQPHISTLSHLYTNYIEDNNENLSDAWSFAKARSNYYKNSYFDFGAQLGSFFLLIDNVTYAEWLISSMNYFSTPYDIVYEKMDIVNAIKQKKYSLNIKLRDNDFFTKQLNDSQLTNIPSVSYFDFNALPFAQRFFSFNIGEKSRLYEQSESHIYSGKWSSVDWDNIWEKFSMEKKNQFNAATVYKDFLNFIIKQNEIIVDDSPSRKMDYFDAFSNILIGIAKSALYKVVNDVSKKDENGNIQNFNFNKLSIFNLYNIKEDIQSDLKMSDLFTDYDKLLQDNMEFKKFIDFLKESTGLNDLNKETMVSEIVSNFETKKKDLFDKIIKMSENRFEIRTLLSILSVYYPEKIDNQFIFNDPNIGYLIKNGLHDSLQLDFLNKKNQKITLPVDFKLPFYMSKFNNNDNVFYESKVVPTYNKKILFPIWIGITLIIGAISIVLYYKRDFA